MHKFGLEEKIIRTSSQGKSSAHFLYTAVNLSLDWLSLFAPQALILLATSSGQTSAFSFSGHPYLEILLQSLTSLATFFFCGVYRDDRSFLNVEESKKIIKGFFLGLTLNLLACEALELGQVGQAYYYSAPVSFLLIFYGKLAMNHKLQFLRDIFGSRALIYGAGRHGREIFSLMANSPKLGLEAVGFIDDDPGLMGQEVYSCGLYRCETARVLGNGRDIERLASELKADELILAIPQASQERFQQAALAATKSGLKLSFVPNFYGLPLAHIYVSQLGGVPLARFKLATASSYLPVKRLFDRVIAGLALFAFSPLLLGLALAVKLSSPGPVIFSHDRVGYKGRIFKMHKFRSMRVESDPYAVNPLHSQDPRITPLGRILRKTSLDELPQLFNVLRGEMSLVGPRPEMPFITERYDDFQRQRLNAPPGITGLWQISVDRKKAIHENLDYDLYYIHNMSFLLDLTIILETFAFVFKGV